MGTEGARILVVEDEPSIAEVLEYNLKSAGFTVAVEARGDLVLDRLEKRPAAALILDLMLPGLDGLDVLKQIRRRESTRGLPVIVLTAKGDEVDRIVGLELGADDYIPKPFSPREVVLRLKALLRRTEGQSDQERLSGGSLTLEVEAHRLLRGEEEIPLTATEFRLLHLLMKRAGRVQSRDMLLSEVWGYSDDVDSRTVDTHVRRLRRKLGDESHRVETVIGVGYRFRE